MDTRDIRIGISSCLLGQPVRYDGGDKRDAFVVDRLARAFTLIPVCPEVGIGLGVPRPPIVLHGDARHPRAIIEGDPQRDITERLIDYGRTRAQDLVAIAGYVFKSRSPSCALTDARVQAGASEGPARGLFAGAMTAALPLLPCEDERGLQDPRLRETFVERVLVYADWQALMSKGASAAALVEFHASHKFTLMAHDAIAYRTLGRQVADAGSGDIARNADDYVRRFLAALRQPATRARHTDVLMHLLGFLKRRLTPADKQNALAAIHRYRRGNIPRSEPLTLLRTYLSREPHPYLERQSYWDTLPMELAE